MWMDADPKLNAAGMTDVFMSYHDIDTNQIQLVTSEDGGQSYQQNAPLINPADVPPDQWASTCPLAGCVFGTAMSE